MPLSCTSQTHSAVQVRNEPLCSVLSAGLAGVPEAPAYFPNVVVNSEDHLVCAPQHEAVVGQVDLTSLEKDLPPRFLVLPTEQEQRNWYSCVAMDCGLLTEYLAAGDEQ